MEEKNKKILIVCKMFIENDSVTILEISEKTGISKSSVQRYLNDKSVGDLITPQVATYIKIKLKEQKQKAAKKGGVNSKKNNVYVRDTKGKFMGSVKNID